MLVPLLGVPIKRERERVGFIYVLMTCVKRCVLAFLILVLDILGLAAIHN